MNNGVVFRNSFLQHKYEYIEYIEQLIREEYSLIRLYGHAWHYLYIELCRTIITLHSGKSGYGAGGLVSQ